MAETVTEDASWTNTTDEHEALLRYSGDIACAYLQKNHIPSAEIPNLLNLIYEALRAIIYGSTSEEISHKPTVTEIKRSIRPDAITSFIDGKPYKTLRRHLRAHGLDEHTYRQKFGLPDDYPMTSVSYSKARSELAVKLGLGRPPSASRVASGEGAAKLPRPSSKHAAE